MRYPKSHLSTVRRQLVRLAQMPRRAGTPCQPRCGSGPSGLPVPVRGFVAGAYDLLVEPYEGSEVCRVVESAARASSSRLEKVVAGLQRLMYWRAAELYH